MQRLSQLGSPTVVSALITTAIILKAKFGVTNLEKALVHNDVDNTDSITIKIAGEEIASIEVVPAYEGEPAYLDIVGQ